MLSNECQGVSLEGSCLDRGSCSSTTPDYTTFAIALLVLIEALCIAMDVETQRIRWHLLGSGLTAFLILYQVCLHDQVKGTIWPVSHKNTYICGRETLDDNYGEFLADTDVTHLNLRLTDMQHLAKHDTNGQ